MIWQILLTYTAVVSWVVVGMYATRPWWRSAYGWNFIALSAGVAAGFTLLAVGGDGEWRRYVWHGLVALVSLAMTHRAVLVAHGIYRDHHPTEGA